MDNSKMTVPVIQLNNITERGLYMINNSLLINSNSFRTYGTTSLPIIAIQINNSEMISDPSVVLHIVLKGASSNCLLINNGKLITSGDFIIESGSNCQTSIEINNSEMKSGTISLSNRSTTTGIKIDNGKMTVPTILIANAKTGLLMNNSGILINTTSFGITGQCDTGIQIDNSEMISTAITLAAPSVVGLLMANNGILNNSGAFQAGGTCTTGISISNSKMTSPTISIVNATTGLSMNNSSILINTTSFRITGTCDTGIQIDNSEMTSTAITLAAPSVVGLLMTNNGILNNSGTFQTGGTTTCATGISISNSEMLCGIISLTTTSLTTVGLSMLNDSVLITTTSFNITSTACPIGIQIDNSEMISPTISILNATTGLSMNNSSILINTTSFGITGTCNTGIQIINSEMTSNAITLANPTVTDLSLANNGILNNSDLFRINGTTCATGISISNSEMLPTGISVIVIIGQIIFPLSIFIAVDDRLLKVILPDDIFELVIDILVSQIEAVI
jgi:hypothetical protein